MEAIKFSQKEELVMQKAFQDGKYTFDDDSFQRPLADLLFKTLIERDEKYHNVFHLTELGKKAVEWNEAIRKLNTN